MKYYSIKQSFKGYTLIELLLVIAVIGMVSSIGIVSFVNYSKKQVFDQAVADFVNTLNTAKSKSYSQVKPGDVQCSGKTLVGYRVRLNDPGAGQYRLSAMCDNTPVAINTTTLPSSFSIAYSPNPPRPILFQVLTGAVSENGNITISGNGYSKVINVSPVGVITLQ